MIHVAQCGRICIGRRKVQFSTVFAGQRVGIREVADDVWFVSCMDYDLGFFDRTLNRVELVGKTPSLQKCYLCPRNKLLPMCQESTV